MLKRVRAGAGLRQGRTIVVSGLSAADAGGMVRLGVLYLPCALGKCGRRVRKHEGDGATPVGCWKLTRVFYRADRIRRPAGALPVKAIRSTDGWCDASTDRNYNRFVRLPYRASAESLWRADHLYDVVVVLNHNTTPRVRGGGSAIFLHVAKTGYAPTEGCVALKREHLLALLRCLGRRATLCVRP